MLTDSLISFNIVEMLSAPARAIPLSSSPNQHPNTKRRFVSGSFCIRNHSRPSAADLLTYKVCVAQNEVWKLVKPLLRLGMEIKICLSLKSLCLFWFAYARSQREEFARDTASAPQPTRPTPWHNLEKVIQISASW